MNNTDNTFLSKESQAALVKKHIESLSQIWRRLNGEPDTKMVDYCRKDTALLVPMDNGTFVAIPKPRMEKEFCFGYSDCGQGMTVDECNSTLDHVNNNLAEWFKDENLKNFDRTYGLEEIDNHEYSDLCLVRPYISQDDENLLRCVTTVVDGWGRREKNYDTLTEADIERYKVALAAVREKFSKQLDTYLKKYGTKKLKTWRYWVDE